MKRIGKTMLTVQAAILLFAAATVVAQDEPVPITLGWAPCPMQDGEGKPLAQAVRYDVYLRRGNDQAQWLATVAHDTTYVLSAERGVVQRIMVIGYDAAGRESPASEWSDPIYIAADERNDGLTPLPPQPQLRPNYPNPFNPETSIVYGVPVDTPDDAHLALEIYNLKGQRVRTFTIDNSPGWHEVTWNGLDDRGQIQATGTYITRYICGGHVEVGKMTMVK